MARDDDNYKAGVDFEWVTAKGSNYKTRKFFTKAEKEAMKAPKKESKAASKPASAAPTKSIRPKAKPASNTASVSAVSGASRGTTGKSATRLARLKKESAMQKDRSAVKLGMTLRERNQK